MAAKKNTGKSKASPAKKPVRKAPAVKRVTRGKKAATVTPFAHFRAWLTALTWRKFFKYGFVASIWATFFLVAILFWYGAELPKLAQNPNFARKASVIIKAADGSIVSRYGDLKGNTVTLDELPAHLPQAVIAIEDRRFYSHFGIDPIGLTRAVITNISGGRLRQGGSTITQQLAKNLFLTPQRTIKRKIQEAMLAIWLESRLSKEEILSAYLNRVYLGSGAYGVDAAARRYFGHSASEVSLQEAAVLAALLKAPSHYSPIHAPKSSERRARVVLGAMVREGFITQSQADTAEDIQVTQDSLMPSPRKQAGYFTDWVITALDDIIGESNEDLVIETTLDLNLQKRAEAQLKALLDANQESLSVSQGALLAMDHNGAILAMVGGKDYRASQFNRATQARRQPGSAFKPILYLTALQQGWDSNSALLDAPLEANSYGKGRTHYNPVNFNDRYYGEISMNQALTYSLNTASVRLMEKTQGPAKTIHTARALGITSPLTQTLSLALGSSGLSLMELTRAYTAIANGGKRVLPYAITRITGADNVLYYSRSKAPLTRDVISRRDARVMTQMLRSVVDHGTGRGAQVDGVQVAGKTGTSQDFRDAWFMGYTDQLVAGVWMGNDDNSPTVSVSGGTLPAQLWRDVMAPSARAYARKGFSFGRGDTGEGFNSLLRRLLPMHPEISRPTYELND